MRAKTPEQFGLHLSLSSEHSAHEAAPEGLCLDPQGLPEQLPSAWLNLDAATLGPLYAQARQRVLSELQTTEARVFPPRPLAALDHLAPQAVRVVVVGQDPYHGVGQAHGLAFSVPAGVRLPPSLRNILAEVRRTQGQCRAQDSLWSWADQGVLLLNTVLTVTEAQANSHAKFGWQALTAQLLGHLAREGRPRAWLLWGLPAQKLLEPYQAAMLPGSLVLTSNHPSPLAARRGPQPFLGNGHFAAVNAWLTSRQEPPIEW